MIELGFIHPESRFKILWEVYLLIVTVAVTIVAPLMVVFEKEITPRLLIFDILVTITFTADIVINFNTAFILRRQLIADRRRIAARYLKNWFFWDLMATLPLTWFFSPGRYAGLNRVLRFFRLARLLKLFGSSRTLGRARRLGLVNPAFTRLFLLVFWILVAAHLIAWRVYRRRFFNERCRLSRSILLDRYDTHHHRLRGYHSRQSSSVHLRYRGDAHGCRHLRFHHRQHCQYHCQYRCG